MRATVARADLESALRGLKKVASNKATLPVLSGAYMTVDVEAGELLATATDLDVTVTRRIAAEAGAELEAGAVVLGVDRLLKVLKGAKGIEAVTIYAETPAPAEGETEPGDPESAELTLGPTTVKVLGFPAPEFPSIRPAPAPGLEIDAEALVALDNRVRFCTSTDETRPSLNGVFVEVGDGQVLATATDGHRLVSAELPARTNGLADKAVIVPPKALALAAAEAAADLKAARKAKLPPAPVRFGYVEADGAGRVGFKIGLVTIVARALEGPFPNYRQVIPTPATWATFDRAALAGALDRVAPLADTLTNQVRLEVRKGRCKVAVSTPDVGEAWEYIDVDGGPAEFTAGYNGDYLAAALVHLPEGERIRVGWTKPVAAAVIEAAGDQGAQGVRSILMPLRLEK